MSDPSGAMQRLALGDDGFTREDAAEVMRKKYRYRQLILSGKVLLPYQRAAQLVGPDCLYHLYSYRESQSSPPRKAKKR